MPVFYEDSLGERLVRHLVEGSSADDELIDDPAALEAAQAAANGRPPSAPPTLDWVAVAAPIVFSIGAESPGVIAAQITMPLDSAEIPYAWDPYPPAEMPLALEPTGMLASRKFTLLVAPEDANVAVALLDDTPASPVPPTAPAAPSVESSDHPFLRAGLIAVAFSAIVAAIYYGYGALQ
jgi:hypothetical protein